MGNMYDGTEVNRLIFDERGQWENPTGKVFKIGKLFYLYHRKCFFWFRLFGKYGMWGRYIKSKQYLLFSERIGTTKYLKIFGWKLKLLKQCL